MPRDFSLPETFTCYRQEEAVFVNNNTAVFKALEDELSEHLQKEIVFCYVFGFKWRKKSEQMQLGGCGVGDVVKVW